MPFCTSKGHLLQCKRASSTSLFITFYKSTVYKVTLIYIQSTFNTLSNTFSVNTFQKVTHYFKIVKDTSIKIIITKKASSTGCWRRIKTEQDIYENYSNLYKKKLKFPFFLYICSRFLRRNYQFIDISFINIEDDHPLFSSIVIRLKRLYYHQGLYILLQITIQK